MPRLVRAVEDDVSRLAAEDALRKMGVVARPLPVQAATEALPSAEDEAPSSLRRRQSVLRVLNELRVSAGDWEQLRAFLTRAI